MISVQYQCSSYEFALYFKRILHLTPIMRKRILISKRTEIGHHLAYLTEEEFKKEIEEWTWPELQLMVIEDIMEDMGEPLW